MPWLTNKPSASIVLNGFIVSTNSIIKNKIQNQMHISFFWEWGRNVSFGIEKYKEEYVARTSKSQNNIGINNK